MGRLFGTNGVRGIANKDLTSELVIKLAATCGYFLGKRIGVGRDGRTTSPLFREAAVSGLLSIGCDVYDLGVLPTPALQHSIKRLNLDGGLMITASHNPPQFNGVKVNAADGVEISRSLEEKIEDLIDRGGPPLKEWNDVGQVHFVDIIPEYIDAILSKVNVDVIRNSNFSVVIDPGNGVSALVAPFIAERLGCKVITINSQIDGRFPGRESEPRPDNLGTLRSLVKATKSDIGVAFDGDADRSIIVDENGEVLWGDRSFALVVKDYMSQHPGEKVVTSLSSSRAFIDIVEGASGELIWTKVGSVDVSRAMVEKEINLGGEENGGIMYGPHHPVRDGSMTMALILEIMARRKMSLSTLVKELPLYYQFKDRVNCPNELKSETLERLKNRVKANHINTMDGLKLSFKDSSWIMFRPSGTEPIFRLYAEAKSQIKANKLVIKYKNLIESVIKEVSA